MTNLERINSISIKGLELLISEKVGMPIKFKVSVRLIRNSTDNYYLVLTSQELKQYAGILASEYKTLTLEDFNGGFLEEEIGYWVAISYRFTYIGGGSNGHALTCARYMFDTKEWVLE